MWLWQPVIFIRSFYKEQKKCNNRSKIYQNLLESMTREGGEKKNAKGYLIIPVKSLPIIILIWPIAGSILASNS